MLGAEAMGAPTRSPMKLAAAAPWRPHGRARQERSVKSNAGDNYLDEHRANVGNHLVFVGKRFKNSRLIALEPMKKQHAILVINTILNNLGDRATIHKVAASSIDGEAQMITPYSGNLGRSMISNAGYGEWVRLVRPDQLLVHEMVYFVKPTFPK